MKASQAKMSVELTKEIQNDKSLKSKAEKERLLREKNANNTKVFIEERKSAAMRQTKHREKLKKAHENQMNDLLKYIQAVSVIYLFAIMHRTTSNDAFFVTVLRDAHERRDRISTTAQRRVFRLKKWDDEEST